MAPRLSSLDGKTIFLVSDGFASADRFLNQIAIWFQKNMPSVKNVYRLKAGSYFDDDRLFVPDAGTNQQVHDLPVRKSFAKFKAGKPSTDALTKLIAEEFEGLNP